jgi:hypothetical protein
MNAQFWKQPRFERVDIDLEALCTVKPYFMRI